MKKNPFLKIIGLAVVLAAAAACIRFHPKPIAPVKAMEDFEARRLDAPELRDFLLRN